MNIHPTTTIREATSNIIDTATNQYPPAPQHTGSRWTTNEPTAMRTQPRLLYTETDDDTPHVVVDGLVHVPGPRTDTPSISPTAWSR
jgi:hypothetical protein